jgi:hypothetical protein
LAAEDRRQGPHREEEPRRGGNPARPIEGEGPAGDEAVEVKVLTPSVTIPTARR